MGSQPVIPLLFGLLGLDAVRRSREMGVRLYWCEAVPCVARNCEKGADGMPWKSGRVQAAVESNDGPTPFSPTPQHI
ncbi:hypothetical protein GGR57DRAFT_471808 [Xylariaceae sp. FL1272]|nr:hypothetical protein GGR57DRAFT_471808 [Xylariaceae sp. FL1272]